LATAVGDTAGDTGLIESPVSGSAGEADSEMRAKSAR
jgi:hypothetical protein